MIPKEINALAFKEYPLYKLHGSNREEIEEKHVVDRERTAFIKGYSLAQEQLQKEAIEFAEWVNNNYSRVHYNNSNNYWCPNNGNMLYTSEQLYQQFKQQHNG